MDLDEFHVVVGQIAVENAVNSGRHFSRVLLVDDVSVFLRSRDAGGIASTEAARSGRT